MKKITGAGASPGVIVGAVYVVSRSDAPMPEFDDPKAALATAVSAASNQLVSLRDQAEASGRAEAAQILGAQSLMAEDPMLVDAVEEQLDEGIDLGTALSTAGKQISDMLAAMDDPYLAARSADVLEVADRVRLHLTGGTDQGLDSVTEPSVVVATHLTAADTAQMDPNMVLGFVTEQGGPTGHVAVIARSLGIPAIVGTSGAVAAADGTSVIGIDGATGEIVLDPDDQTLEQLESRRKAHLAAEEAATAYKGKPAAFGERRVLIAANIGNEKDLAQAVAQGADGVGLYRTEFLFLERTEAPSEDEQYETYRSAVASFDHPVVIRTLDIGGDKPADYLETPVEENPFLGERAVRLYEGAGDVFLSQARALLRAATAGELWVMVPMIATVADWDVVTGLFDVARKQLDERGETHGTPRFGMMVEVPAAAVAAEQLARRVDFFSIGTNDLTQYTMAADRTNARLNAYSDAAHPAVLRLCNMTATAARNAGISVAVCGESAADPVTGALFAAMGINELSVAPTSVNRTKSLIDQVDPETISDALTKALGADSAADVRSLVTPLLGR
ncbi:MAG: phosphoenolpyruvate--protein phosphotransferase [Acidimicrobiia bacterium]|nr:phosphoenolpyruvate--protein phosphotransferase [Acidimicrobiia bacterium]